MEADLVDLVQGLPRKFGSRVTLWPEKKRIDTE